MRRQEIYSLTGLRGAAATLVMFYHFNASRLVSWVGGHILGHCYLMVDLFLVLSGFILAMTYGQRFEQGVELKSYGTFVKRRFARIFPIFFLMTITAGILIATGWMDHWPGPAIPVSGLINFTMLQSVLHVPTLDTPGWSVSAEWIASLLFPFFALLFLRRSWMWAILGAVIGLITLPVLVHLPALAHEPKRAGLMDLWNYETIYPVVRCIAEFILGVITFRVSQLAWVKQLISHDWIAPVLFFLILVLMAMRQADVWVVALLPLFILSLISRTNIVARFMGSKPIYRLGQISYSIYLIHNQMNYFMLSFARYLESIGVGQTAANTIAMFIFVAIVIVFAEMVYRYIEKPARNYINGFVLR